MFITQSNVDARIISEYILLKKPKMITATDPLTPISAIAKVGIIVDA